MFSGNFPAPNLGAASAPRPQLGDADMLQAISKFQPTLSDPSHQVNRNEQPPPHLPRQPNEQPKPFSFTPNPLNAPHPSSSSIPSSSAVPSTPAIALPEEVDRAKHPSGIVPTVQNIVSTCNLNCALDLKAIALRARNAEYNPKRFAAVIMRIREPKTTALIFASGKMVCTGAKSEDMSKLAARKYARIIQKLGFAAHFSDFKIQNIVASTDVKFPIRLEQLQIAHQRYSHYEPELFPGLIYRMVSPKIVLLIFVSGKIVLTGAKVRDDIYQGFENIYPSLCEYRKPPAQRN